jgi:hypothetical protein
VEGQIKEVEEKQEKKKAEVMIYETNIPDIETHYLCSLYKSRALCNNNPRRLLLLRMLRRQFPLSLYKIKILASYVSDHYFLSLIAWSTLPGGDSEEDPSLRARARSCSVSGLLLIFSNLNLFIAEIGGQLRMTTISCRLSSII